MVFAPAAEPEVDHELVAGYARIANGVWVLDPTGNIKRISHYDRHDFIFDLSGTGVHSAFCGGEAGRGDGGHRNDLERALHECP
jgi:hypothetical protein